MGLSAGGNDHAPQAVDNEGAYSRLQTVGSVMSLNLQLDRSDHSVAAWAKQVTARYLVASPPVPLLGCRKSCSRAVDGLCTAVARYWARVGQLVLECVPEFCPQASMMAAHIRELGPQTALKLMGTGISSHALEKAVSDSSTSNR